MKESSQLGAQPAKAGNGYVTNIANIVSNEQKLCFLQKLLQGMDLSDLSESDQRQMQLRMARFSSSALANPQQLNQFT